MLFGVHAWAQKPCPPYGPITLAPMGVTVTIAIAIAIAIAMAMARDDDPVRSCDSG
jgi:hypothetical protein